MSEIYHVARRVASTSCFADGHVGRAKAHGTLSLRHIEPAAFAHAVGPDRTFGQRGQRRSASFDFSGGHRPPSPTLRSLTSAAAAGTPPRAWPTAPPLRRASAPSWS